MFLIVSIMTLGLQIFLVEIGGDFVRTSPLTLIQWLITIALGFIGVPIGILVRLIPVSEDPESFFTADSVLNHGVTGIEISDDRVDDNQTDSDKNEKTVIVGMDVDEVVDGEVWDAKSEGDAVRHELSP